MKNLLLLKVKLQGSPRLQTDWMNDSKSVLTFLDEWGDEYRILQNRKSYELRKYLWQDVVVNGYLTETKKEKLLTVISFRPVRGDDSISLGDFCEASF